MDIQKLAHEAALESIRMIGDEPDLDGDDEKFKLHRNLLHGIFHNPHKRLMHPNLINITLRGGGHQELRLRRGVRASYAKYMPHPRYLQAILHAWWIQMHVVLPEIKKLSIDDRREFAWQQHDYLVCVDAFAVASDRTARAVFYNLCVVLDVPIEIIKASDAVRYNEKVRKYREELFAPRMQARGYMRP